MKAVYIEKYGSLNIVQQGEQPQPQLRFDEVMVQVHAASVNPLDLRTLKGEFKAVLPVSFPFILGNDLAGIITAVGDHVKDFKVGDEVYAKTDNMGSFAEFSVVKQTSIALKPNNLSMQQAAALPLVALTAWQALVETAQLKKNQKILIHAGSGGVGSIAIQLAKHLGATVATTTGTNNVDWVKALGADIVIDYKTTDFEEVIQDYDFVLDTQGGKILEQSLNVLKSGGSVISIAGPPDHNFAKSLEVNWLLKRITPLLSLMVRIKANNHHVNYLFLSMQPDGQQLTEITHLVEKGKIVPVIDQVYDFNQIKQALEYVSTGRAKGKVVIESIKDSLN